MDCHVTKFLRPPLFEFCPAGQLLQPVNRSLAAKADEEAHNLFVIIEFLYSS
jgi:hypothetical protein